MADRVSLEKLVAEGGGRPHIGFPSWLSVFAQSGTLAITLGRHVFLGEAILTRRAEEIEATVRHELEHVKQFARLGYFGFFSRYISDYIRNRRHGLPPHEAYHGIGLEVEARLAEAVGGTSPEGERTEKHES